jgi:predicted CoA-binding protein
MTQHDEIKTAITAPIVFRAIVLADGKYSELAESIIRSLADSGYAIVPVEPTQQMLTAAFCRERSHGHSQGMYGEIYRAMVRVPLT